EDGIRDFHVTGVQTCALPILLEKYSVKKAHFHWFKGDNKTLQHMAENGYFISFTPDLMYEEEIQTIARNYPLEQVMVETDGPWRSEERRVGKECRWGWWTRRW